MPLDRTFGCPRDGCVFELREYATARHVQPPGRPERHPQHNDRQRYCLNGEAMSKNKVHSMNATPSPQKETMTMSNDTTGYTYVTNGDVDVEYGTGYDYNPNEGVVHIRVPRAQAATEAINPAKAHTRADLTVTTPGGTTLSVIVPTPSEGSPRPFPQFPVDKGHRVRTDCCVALHDQVWVPEVARAEGDTSGHIVTTDHHRAAKHAATARWVLPVPMSTALSPAHVALLCVARVGDHWVSEPTVMISPHTDHVHADAGLLCLEAIAWRRAKLADLARAVTEMAAYVADALNAQDNPRTAVPDDVVFDDFELPAYHRIARVALDELRNDPDADTTWPFLTVEAVEALTGNPDDLVRLGRDGIDKAIAHMVGQLPQLRADAGWGDPVDEETTSGIYDDPALNHEDPS